MKPSEALFSKEAYLENLKKRQTEFIYEIADNLAEAQRREPLSTLEEDIFVHVFLPFFCGEDNTYKVGLGNWETVASGGTPGPGGLYKEVIIVDKENKELFRVPPIYDRSAIKPFKLSDTIALQSLLERTEAYAMIKPQLGIDHLSRVFSNLLSKMKIADNNALDYLKRWNDIFIRYQKTPLFVEKNSVHQSSEGTSTEYSIEDI